MPSGFPSHSNFRRTQAPSLFRPRTLALLVSGVLAAGLSSTVFSQEASEIDWVPLDQLTPEQRAAADPGCCGMYVQPAFPELPPEASPDDINIDAADLVYEGDGIIQLTGDVRSFQEGRLTDGDVATYDQNADVLTLEGNVRIREQNLLLAGMSARADRATGHMNLEDASYLLHDTGIRGTADSIAYDENIDVITIDNGAMSRCEPASNAWMLNASTLKLDQEKGRGYAWHATLRVKDIPVLYSPWLSFPINDERMSGFLYPAIGSTRDGGVDLTLPYYFNLAPNYDATYIPRYMSDRGFQHGAELRFLGDNNSEEVNFTYLGNDDQYDPAVLAQIDQAILAGDQDLLATLESAPTDDRWYLNWQHRGRYGQRWSSFVDYNAVSDMEYMEDFGTSGLQFSSPSYLTRNAYLKYSGEYWDFTSQLLGYQNIDPLVSELNSSLDQLPSFTLNGAFSTDFNIDYGLFANYTFFDSGLDTDDYSQAIIDQGLLAEGGRLHLAPNLSYSWSTPGMFVKPGLKYQYTQYSLDRQRAGTEDTPHRGVATTTLDTGLIFERDLSLFDMPFQQTLEPRLYYLYTEYEDQDDLPLFDSTLNTFSSSQLFRDDRFSGDDRIGDANQLTAALTTRLLDERGREKASASIGQIMYFEDRRVTLYGTITPEETRDTSNVVAEASWNMSDLWSVRSYLEWNSTDNTFDAGSVQLRYAQESNKLFNLGLRFRDDATLYSPNPDIDPRIIQSDISAAWPIVDQWSAFARFNYDHANNRTLESMAGVEYDSCCWATRIVYREWMDTFQLNQFEDGRYNAGLFIEFELKGFGSILGGNVQSILQNSISGYSAR